MGIELKIQHMTMDGLPYTCPECGTSAFTLDARGIADVLSSVWATCSTFHSWEVMIFDIDDLRAINSARTGRQRAEDIDTFRVVIGGAVLEGVLHPGVILDDVKRAVTDAYWERLIKPELRRRKNKVKQAIKQPIRAARNAAKTRAADTVAAAKAAAIGAAWDWQTVSGAPDPDYQPEPVTPCAACRGKGGFDITSRIHDISYVTCTVCLGTGEAD